MEHGSSSVAVSFHQESHGYWTHDKLLEGDKLWRASEVNSLTGFLLHTDLTASPTLLSKGNKQCTDWKNEIL